MKIKPLVRVLPAVLMVVVALALSPARSAPITGDGRRATLYLHSTSPVATTQTAPSLVDAASKGPGMDETAPTGATPKTAVNGPGNADFRKNFLLGFWAAEVHGHVTNAHAKLWVNARAGTEITATVFGDGGVGVSSRLGRAAKATTANGISVLELDIPVDGHVDREIVLSLSSGSTPTTVLYDAVDFASALSFDLGVYDPPPFGIDFPPATGWDAVEPVSLTKANRESSLVLNPVNEDEMVMCDPSGVPSTTNGHSYFYVTTDGGASWADLEVEPEGDARRNAFEGGDCDVAYDAGGTIYTADTWLGNLSVGASRDGGKTWTGTPIAVQAPFVDRPWLVGGPDGTVYLTYQDVQFGMPSVIWFLKSTDHGRTFSTAVPVTTGTQNGAFTWTGNFVVSGQDLYSVYTRRAQPTIVTGLDAGGSETVWVAKSHDGGATWTQQLIATMPNPASYLYPVISMDAGGALHAVFASKSVGDRPVWYTTSTDKAATWTSPIPLTTGTAGFAPWIAAGDSGEAVVIWYGSPNPVANVGTGGGTHDWYLYWARISDFGSTITSGTTTVKPLFKGNATMPEFNQVRLDSQGKMRIGASVQGVSGGWVAYYQQES